MFEELQGNFSGELYFDNSTSHQAILFSYATDASVYQEKPVAVALPKTTQDIRQLVLFAERHGLTLIPRAAGTSLAGQVVGSGIITDISKYFTAITAVNREEAWVTVEPGVIRDDLNAYLKPMGLMFGPETSTASRAMIGGMIGNNSCGLHSIIWGDTRNNLLEVTALLADGSEIVFGNLNQEEFDARCNLQNAGGRVYREMKALLANSENAAAILNGFPTQSVTRRNTGYALDRLLAATGPGSDGVLNFSQLIAGSEGTLCFITSAKLKLIPLPPRHKCIVAVHTVTIAEALQVNLIALAHHCSASELVDDIILAFTKVNIDQSKNRFFIQGEPRAILMVEFFDASPEGLTIKATTFIEAVKSHGYGYAFPVLHGADSDKAWDLRKAGLGLLRNEPGDDQPVNLIEDCAVSPQDLPAYIADVERLLKKYNIKYSMYAHAGAGEIHVEPMLNLKTSAGKLLFRTVLQETAALVKKYRGSLSGEHGDGRLRGEFIPYLMGEKIYALFKEVKEIFDPKAVFNRGKIVDTPPMNEFLRYMQDKKKTPIDTVFDFSRQEGILHLAEKCSGSGDCRKSHISGGTMCPSFMATRSEQDSTRARANMLRHYYSGKAGQGMTAVNAAQVMDVLELCLSCKGCKSECPSGVDVSKMKAEFTQEYYDRQGFPLRSRLVGGYSSQMALASRVSWLYNFVYKHDWLKRIANRAVGFHPRRSMPLLQPTTLRTWFERREKSTGNRPAANGQVYVFCDEFTNYQDVPVGQKMIGLLERLGYEVILPTHLESGRTWLSKGMVRKAKEIAVKNVERLSKQIAPGIPILGIEPSAILTLRDEYPELVSPELRSAARTLAAQTFLFEEWFAAEIGRGKITVGQFTEINDRVVLHGHCHQKALSSTKYILESLAVVPGLQVQEIPSGCCGMAGSFGYEKEHYELSMKIGALVLFPAIEQTADGTIIAASGTSCRHQIKDGTGRTARHTAEILYDALLR